MTQVYALRYNNVRKLGLDRLDQLTGLPLCVKGLSAADITGITVDLENECFDYRRPRRVQNLRVAFTMKL
jgi:hypothetical protein